MEINKEINIERQKWIELKNQISLLEKQKLELENNLEQINAKLYNLVLEKNKK